MTTHGYSLPPKRRPRARVLIACLLLLPVMLLGLAVSARHAAHHRTPPRAMRPHAFSDAAGALGGLPADVYPSRRSALASAAARLPAIVASVLEDPSEVRIDAGGCDDANVFRDAVRGAFPGARCTVADSGALAGESADVGAAATVRIRVAETAEDSCPVFPLGPTAPSARRGEITIRATGPSGRSASGAVRYDARPWLDDFTAFSNSHPGGAWLTARSRRPGASPTEARAEAEAAAAEAVAEVLHSRAPGSDAMALRLAQREVRGGRLVADRFVQRFHRPYGDFWSEAVLVDVSPQRLSPLVTELRFAERSQRVSRVGRAAAAGALLLVILGLYALLNAVTRSYFTGRLRLGAAVASALVLAFACGA